MSDIKLFQINSNYFNNFKVFELFINRSILIIASIFLLSYCSSPPFTTDIIMFDKEFYAPTIANDIKVFNSRLDIPNKYSEIGTIKFQGTPIIERIKELASTKGADAVIKDSNNFILIKYQTKEEVKPDETKTI
jgi:hypothetical protein